MFALVILSFLIFIAYLFITISRYGIPPSLSETYYLLGKTDKGFNRLKASVFTFMMWAISFTLLPAMLENTPDGLQFLAFLALASICFVGAAPQFKQEFEGKIHTRAAWVAAIFGILWSLIVTSDGAIMLAVSLMTCLIIGGNTKTLRTCKVFWAEMVAFCTVFHSALTQIIING